MSRPLHPSSPLRSLLSVLALGLAACGGDSTTTPDPGDHDHAHAASGAICPTGNTLTYANFGAGFMESYCTTCHRASATGAARGGAPLDHNYETLAGVQKWKTEIDEHAAVGPAASNTAMPPSRPTPTTAEREQLGQWLACGAQ